MAEEGMELGHMGIVIDADGAARSVRFTTAELANLANQSVRTEAATKGLGKALSGPEGPGGPPSLPPKIDRITQAIDRMRASAARKLDLDLARQLALLDPFERRVDRITLAIQRMRAAAAQKADLQLAAQIAQLDPFEKKIDRVTLAIRRMKAAAAQKSDLVMAGQIAQLDPFQQQITRTTQRIGTIAPAAGGARLSLGRLGNQFAGLATGIAGLHPVVGNIVGVFGNFALGSPLMTGVLAGVAAVAAGYAWMTREARAAEKANDDLRTSLQNRLIAEKMGPGMDIQLELKAERDAMMADKWKRTQLLRYGTDPNDSRITTLNSRIAASQANLVAGEKLLEKARQDAAVPLKTVEITGRNIKQDQEKATRDAEQYAKLVQGVRDYVIGQDLAQRAATLSIEQGKTEALRLRDAALQGAVAFQRVQDEIEVMNQLQAAGISIFDARYEALKRELEATIRLKRETGQIVADREEWTKEAQRSANAAGQIMENFWRGAQEGASRFFETTLRDGLKSFRSLFGSIRDLFLKLVADLLAAKLMQRLAGGILGVAAGGAAGAAAAGGGAAYGAGLSGLGASMLAPVGIGLAGGLIGYQLGQGARSGLGGGIRGAAGGAVAGAAIGSIVPGIGTAVGAFIGGVTGFIGGVFGAGKAAKEAAREVKKLQDSLKLNMEAWRASLRGDDLAVALAQSMARLKEMLLAINAAYPGTRNEPERNRQRAEAEALQRQEAERIRQDHAQMRRYAQEDLQVRLLRARGMSAEAEALAFAQQQERELAAARAAGADAAYLATLAEVHAAEALARIMGTLTDAVRNAPTGFDIVNYGGGRRGPSGEIIGPFEPPGQPRPPTPVPVPPQGGGGGGGPGDGTQPMVVLQFSDGAFILNGNESPEQLVRKMLRGARSIASATVGNNVPIAQAFDLIR